MKKKLAGMLTLLFLVASYSTANAAPADDRDCGDFANHQEVMQFWYENGYSASNDPHDLDRDGDGLACEVSYGEYAEFVAQQKMIANQRPANESNDEPAESKSDDEAVESQSHNEAAESESGEQMPDTASNGLLLALISAGFVGIGSLLVFSRKKKQV